MMTPAQGDRELVADFAAECSGLGEAQMMGVGRLPAADQARLLGNVSDVISVPNAARLGEGEGAFVDPLRS